MIPAPKDITIQQGDTFQLLFRVRSQVWDSTLGKWVPGPYVNLTGATPKAQIRATAASTTVIAELTGVVLDQMITETLGGVLFSLTSSQTLSLVPTTTAKYVYDAELTLADGTVNTYLSGKVTVKPGVTRP